MALASQPVADVTVTISGYGSTDLTVDTDSVMVGAQATLTFTTVNWSTAQIVSLSATQDNDNDNDSTTLTHAPSGGGYGSAQNKNLEVTITDDEAVPTLKVEIPTVTEGETGTIKLTLSQVSQSIEFVVGSTPPPRCSGQCPPGTSAARPSDYSFTSTTITFAPGETTKTLSFSTTDDSTVEATEVFIFGISSLAASEATIDPSTPADRINFGNPTWFVQILDNDNPANPNVMIVPRTSLVTEGVNVTFTVTATPVPTSATTVSVAVTEDTSGGQDFVASSNEITHTVTIPASGSPGAGTATLTIATVGDSMSEPNGEVTATVAGGTGYTVGNPSSATVTVNDDTARLVFMPDTVSVNEGASGSYTVALAREPSANVTVTISGQEGSDLTVDTDSVMVGAQATLTFTTSNWSTAQTVSIEAAQDDDSANDSITLAHTPSGGSYGSAQNKNLEAIITDDDTDTTSPTVTSITRQSPSSSPTNADSLTWRVTFNEVVQNVDAADFQVSNTTALLSVSQVTGMNAYDVTASGGNLAGLDDTVTLSFNSSHNIQDTSGNALASSPTPTGTNHASYVVDNTAPTAAITGLSGTISGAVTATFTFSETVTGFTSSDIMVTNSAVSDFPVVTAGRIWTARITPSINGTAVTINVPVNAAQDQAGNASTAARASANYTAPLSAPVGFTASPGDGQAALSWASPVDSANTAAVTKYQYRYQAGSSVTTGTWTDVADGGDAGSDVADETAVTVTGLTNGAQYAFELRAVNGAGNGAAATATATPASSDSARL